MKASPHPLLLWLDRRGESVADFAARINRGFGTIYALCRKGGKSISLALALDIQRGTGGEVSVLDLHNWNKTHDGEGIKE